ncbi:MAG: GNAT family N-acetyltransferase [Acidobacteria bacterium]|nr:GNAT family N-acetyltransferase [Acidobacteriota bacterium]
MESEISIIGFDRAYADAFAELNYQWISQYFVVEEHDREMLDHPVENIIEKGGWIFFAVAENNAVGTVALVDDGEDRFELAKMAVSSSFRRRGIGDRLIEACVEYAAKNRKGSVFLLSNTLLEPAINLYRKHGFVETVLDQNSPYERVNIRMELALPVSNM